MIGTLTVGFMQLYLSLKLPNKLSMLPSKLTLPICMLSRRITWWQIIFLSRSLESNSDLALISVGSTTRH